MKNNIPKIRFKGFDEEWVESQLGEIANITIGEFVIRTKQNPNSPYPVYNGGKSNTGFYDEFNNEGNKIIISARGANAGFVNFEKRRYWAGNSCYSISMDDKNSYFVNYFYYFIKKNENKFKDNQQAANIPSVSKMDTIKFIVNYPKYKEQTKIGKFFQKLDKLIESKQKRYNKLQNIKKAMLEKMFPKNGATTPQIRFKGYNDGWVEKSLGEIAEFSKGQGYSKNDIVEKGNPIILYGRLYTKYQTVISEVDTYVLGVGGSIYSKGREVIVPASGETAEDIVRASAVIKEGIIIGGDLNIIYPKEYINSIFLALTISNGRPQKDLSKKAQGKSVVHLRNNDLKEVEILYPSNKEQTKIGEFFQKFDKLLTLQKQELEKLKNIKKALLEKMFV